MHEVPLFPLWVTILTTILAATGSLIGVVIGHFLSRSSQRRQWIADNEKEEYRRILAALDRVHKIAIESAPIDMEQLREAVDKITEAANTSLFIHDFLQKSKVLDTITGGIQSLINEDSTENYNTQHWIVVNQIIAAARKHID